MPNTTVRYTMSPVVETLQVGDTLETARDHLERGRIRHLPVIDGQERVVGLLTHRNLLGAWVSHGHPERERMGAVQRDVPVEMVMEKEVRLISPDTAAAHAALLLETYKYGCLPVVQHGKLVGILTETDFVRFAREHLERQMLE